MLQRAELSSLSVVLIEKECGQFTSTRIAALQFIEFKFEATGDTMTALVTSGYEIAHEEII